MTSSCPNYLHADVSDGEDLSRHQQEVTDEIWRPDFVSDWWATCHDESCARYSRLRCVIGVSLLLPPLHLQRKCPPWTAAEGSVPRDRTGKKKKESGVSMSLSVPLDKGDRVRTG